MDPFISNDQYNFIKLQTLNIVNAQATVTDKDVIDAVKHNAINHIMNHITDLKEEQKSLLGQVINVVTLSQSEAFLNELQQYVIPFKQVTEKQIIKLFPKVKKLQLPDLNALNFKELTYLEWYDLRAQRKYLIFEYDDELKGFSGTFLNSHVKGICSLCNSHAKVGLFMARTKSGKETYVNRGNYICNDSTFCNQQITDQEMIKKFVASQLK